MCKLSSRLGVRWVLGGGGDDNRRDSVTVETEPDNVIGDCGQRRSTNRGMCVKGVWSN